MNWNTRYFENRSKNLCNQKDQYITIIYYYPPFWLVLVLLVHEYSAIQLNSCGIDCSTSPPQFAHALVQLF